MVKKTITYTDYNDVTWTEDFYFNLTEAEVAEMELGTTGGFSEYIKRITAAKDVPAVAKVFKELLLKAYGIKSPDGKRFIKSEELSTEFSQSPAYSVLYMELATDEGAASDFINRLAPKKKGQ